MQVTSKVKFVKKQKARCPKITFLPFFLKKIRMTIKPLKIAAKIIFISRKINLNIQNLKIIPYNQKKMQIQHGALFLQFSIHPVYSMVFSLGDLVHIVCTMLYIEFN